MPIEVILPKVDMDMVSGTIEAWRVVEGDSVQSGQLLFEIGTNKAVMEVDAPASGIIRRITGKIGDVMPVGSVVAWIYGAGEALEQVQSAPLQTLQVVSKASNGNCVDSAVSVSSARLETPLEIRATPLARRVARQLSIDISMVSGTGPKGRINESDVHKANAKNSVVRPASPSADLQLDRTSNGATLQPFSAIRRLVAERLTQSATTVPHFYVTAHIDMSATMALLKRVAPHIQARTGVKPSLTIFLAHVTGRLLQEHPLLNASVEGEATRLHPASNIGVAMERDGDLMVPVIQNAGNGRLSDTALAFDALRKAVSNRTIKPADLSGGTFTLSNLGMYGVDAFTAIINPPQSAILAVGRTVDTPVGVEGQIVLRPLATFCLSSDHRIVDGVTAARFMADLRKTLEQPEMLI
jgi:pyruvate dehydrogenase E2 component (dihydrolipoamide acetyltransferase)